jgi:O-antigen/teichoic acid export membrane protein
MLPDRHGRVDFEMVELALAVILGLATYSLMHDGGLALGWSVVTGFVSTGVLMALSFGKAVLQDRREVGGETGAILLPLVLGGTAAALAQTLGEPVGLDLALAAGAVVVTAALCWWILRRHPRMGHEGQSYDG